jgi:predicted neuraminidase
MEMFVRPLLLLLLLVSQAMAQNPAILTSQLIFPLQDKHVHGSSLVALPNGDLLAVWFYGSGERTANDVKLMGSRLAKGQGTWSSPFLMADTPNLPDCNPVLFLNQKGMLYLVWIAVQANRWETSILRVKTSKNYLGPGAPVWNWQEVILLNPGDEFEEEVRKKFQELPKNSAGWAEYAPSYDRMIVEAAKDPKKRSTGWMTRIKPLVFADGRIILPLYSDGFNFSMMAISTDFGETWEPSLPLVGRGPIQPALVEKSNGNLAAFLRDSGDAPARVHYSESSDGGRSWTESQKTEIPNTASVEILKLKDGRWAFLGNDIENGRYRLSLYLSDDEGTTWKWRTQLENQNPGEGSFSYPSLIQTEDGLLHITYSYHLQSDSKSIRYVVVNPNLIPVSPQ